MTGHHLRFVLRQYIEHKNRSNLRLHVWTNGVAWLALVTLLSQVPLPTLPGLSVPSATGNAGALFAAVSVLYWLPVDRLVTVAVAMLTAAWALVPGSAWGPGHGLLAGVVAPVLVFATMSATAHYAHVYHHEHAKFLNGGPRSEAVMDGAHVALWGIFHFWLEASLHAGWRPRLRAELDAAEREVLRGRAEVPWMNWAGLAGCEARRIYVPQTLDDLADAVRDARTRGLRSRVVASGFSWSSLVPSEDALIFCERLDGITVDVSNPSRPTVWAEAGVTNRQLNHELERHGLCMPWNVVLETVRVAGIASTGTHGTGKATSTVGDLVEAFDIVDAKGARRVLSDETVGVEMMNAARLSLGLFGVIARVLLRVVPIHRVSQTDLRLPMKTMLAQLSDLIATHDSVELYWFPFNEDVWVRTIDRTEAPRTSRGHGFWFRTQNFLQNGWLVLFSKLVLPYVPSITPTLLHVGMQMLPFATRVVNLPDSHHYHHWIEMMPCGCMEVGFKDDADHTQMRAAWETTQRLVAAYEQRGLYPLNLSLNVRFIGSSASLLTPAYGEGLTCYVEIMWIGRPEGWKEFTSELCNEWLKVPGALPHWSKEFEHVADVVATIRRNLGDRRPRFLTALAESGIDPDHAFENPLVRRVLTEETPSA